MQSTKFMTAEDKNLVLKQWVKFTEELASDNTDANKLYRLFTKRLYQHLIQHCSFIAHYNRQGFFQVYFKIDESTIKFVKQFDEAFGFGSCEYGNNYWYTDSDYHDLNSAMCEAIEPVKAAIYVKCEQSQKHNDIELARRLLAKHGIVLE